MTIEEIVAFGLLIVFNAILYCRLEHKLDELEEQIKEQKK